eukprot:TRINITY_DN8231_c1_g1_i2.p1 TRINITY_DN8231_c1_g1~~TRINITY_DN8231_c1_g1_i2.p1  ORF type:complete len:577 (+),score=122.18 TRINITY_DN8231_c1_g1_i2:1402-3132(+)
MFFPGTQEMHIFAIGDWGGMDGSLNPIEGRTEIIAYSGGKVPGPSVFPRTRWNLMHDELLCSHKEFLKCFETHGDPPCAEGCGFVRGVDDNAQKLVAKAFKERAAQMQPQFILNVGDNFYWGGIEKTCGTPMNELSYTAHHQFNQIYEGVYNGPGLDGKAWISVLGNHDWGGRVFNNGWDQQIAYTWKSNRWVMPAAYYSTKAVFPDQNFSIDLFMLDSNMMDASDPEEDPEHNVCGSKYNPANADCSSQGGPASIKSCKKWFWDLWEEQKPWIQQKLKESEADWQIIVTHFPCGHEKVFYQQLHQHFGLDLLVTGHRHDQELWDPSRLGGLTCFVTGGGGGITSEATPDISNTTQWYGEAQYGFYDLVINKRFINITSINWNSTELMSAVVWPKAIPMPATKTASTTTTTTSAATHQNKTEPADDGAGASEQAVNRTSDNVTNQSSSAHVPSKTGDTAGDQPGNGHTSVTVGSSKQRIHNSSDQNDTEQTSTTDASGDKAGDKDADEDVDEDGAEDADEDRDNDTNNTDDDADTHRAGPDANAGSNADFISASIADADANADTDADTDIDADADR